MLKLLLLTIFSFFSFSNFFAAGLQRSNRTASLVISLNDSTIKDAITGESRVVNGRAGFKNLFVENGATTMAVKLNPMAVSFVQDYMADHAARLTKMKSWGKPYFDMMDGVLAQY